jgi:fructokinase
MRTIAVLGEALVDVFPDREVIGGAPFNVARNLAALGEAPLMLTRIGEDARGARIAAEFARHGLTTDGLQHDPARPTGVVRVLIDAARREQHRFEIGAGCAWDALDQGLVKQALARTPPTIVYFGTLAQREAPARAAIRAGLTAAALAGATRFLDLNLREGLPDARRLALQSLELADVLKVNEDELAQLQAWLDLGPEALVRRFGLRRLILTRGGRGWSCFDARTAGWLHGGAPAVTVRDTVGAGDAFAAVALQGLLRQWPLDDTMQRAAAHAAHACTFEGALGFCAEAASDPSAGAA